MDLSNLLRDVAGMVELSDGRLVEIMKFKGKHLFKVGRIQQETGEEILPIILSIVTRIDGEQMTLDLLADLEGIDYVAILTEFDRLNPFPPIG